MTSPSLLQAVGDFYGIGECNLVNSIRPWRGSLCWKLRNSSGNYFILKEKPPFQDKDEFNLHLGLHQFLWTEKGPVVRLLSSENKSVLAYEHRYFELQDWFVGRHFETSTSDSYALGKLVAEFDELARAYRSAHQGDWQFPKYRHTYFPDMNLNDWMQTAERINDHLCSANREAKEISRWLDEHLDPAHTKTWKGLPQQFIHGDIDRNNAKRNSSKSVVLDLEDARWGYRLTEVARACAVIGGFGRGRAGQTTMRRNLNLGSIRSFIRGYDSARRLAETEILLLSDFIGLNLIGTFANCFCADEPLFSQSFLRLQSQRLNDSLRAVDGLDFG